MNTSEATTILSQQLTATGTKDYVNLVHVLSQEIGLMLCFLLDPIKTAEFKTTESVLEPNLYDQFLDILLENNKVKKDIENLEMEIHKQVASLFKKNREKLYFQNGLQTVSKEKN